MSLHASSYTTNKDTHDKRDDLTNEVTCTGYTASGVATSVTVGAVTTNDRVDVTFGVVSWTTATITARYGVISKMVLWLESQPNGFLEITLRRPPDEESKHAEQVGEQADGCVGQVAIASHPLITSR